MHLPVTQCVLIRFVCVASVTITLAGGCSGDQAPIVNAQAAAGEAGHDVGGATVKPAGSDAMSAVGAAAGGSGAGAGPSAGRGSAKPGAAGRGGAGPTSVGRGSRAG